MYVVLISSFIASILTYLQRYNYKKAMSVAFIIICFISCIRCDYGNDYNNYYNIYQNIISQPFSFSSLFKESEPGWTLLCYLTKPLGYFGLIAVLSIFQITVYYRFINKYVPIRDQWIAVVLYLFNPTIWLLQLSMMSQGLAIAIFLVAFPYIEKKKWKQALLLLCLASTFHISALILIPFAFLGIIKVNGQRMLAILLIAAFIAMFFSSIVLESVFGAVVQLAQFQEYADYYGAQKTDEVSFGLGFLLQLVPYIVAILLLFKNKYNHTFLVAVVIYVVAVIILPISSIIPLATRVSYYFEVFSIITIPFILSQINNKTMRYFVFFIVLFMMAVNYTDFFSINSIYHDYYIEFKTVFDSEVTRIYK